MKSVIAYGYEKRMDTTVDTVMNLEPRFMILKDYDGEITVERKGSEEWHFEKCLGKPNTEHKRDNLIRNWCTNKGLYYINAKTYCEIKKNPKCKKVEKKFDEEKVQTKLNFIFNKADSLYESFYEIANGGVLSYLVDIKSAVNEIKRML